ncbi:MAG: Clp protease N-terminal domain-containing protein, partial [Acidimicrobiales bacterium]
LGHGYIGTEHLLLSLLSNEGTPARQTLERLGVTADATRDDIIGIVGRGEGAGSGHIPFTPRSKKVLELSLREALALKHNHIAPEHILLGLLREGEGLAAQILFKRSVDLLGLREEIIQQMPPGESKRSFLRRGARATDPLRPMTASAAQVGVRAAHLAGGAPVASHHYLLGLFEDDQSVAAKALAALGVTREEVEVKLAELGTEGTSDEPPEQWGARNTSLEAEGDLVTVRIGDADLAARVRDMFQSLHVDLLRGPQLPGADTIWMAVRPAVEESVRRLEQSSAAAEQWEPLAWSKAGIATYSVLSKPTGPTSKLWTAEGVNPQAVRTFLADVLAERAPGRRDEDRVAYLSIAVSRVGDVVPDAEDPDALIVSHWSCGPGGPRLDWPRVPLADLVAAALADLNQEPAV